MPDNVVFITTEAQQAYYKHLIDCSYCRRSIDWCSLGFKLQAQFSMIHYPWEFDSLNWEGHGA